MAMKKSDVHFRSQKNVQNFMQNGVQNSLQGSMQSIVQNGLQTSMRNMIGINEMKQMI